MATDPSSLTADDVLDLPVPDDAIGYEFVDGKPVLVMPASPIHGWLAVEVAYRLKKHVVEHDLTGTVCYDCGFVLGLTRDPERMRGPTSATSHARRWTRTRIRRACCAAFPTSPSRST